MLAFRTQGKTELYYEKWLQNFFSDNVMIINVIIIKIPKTN